jgi:hypothetical protein
MPNVTVPKVLLLVYGDPRSLGIGNIFLRETVQHYPRERLFRYSLVPHNAYQGEVDWHGVPTITRRARTSIIPIVSSLLDWRFRLLSARRMAEEIEQFVAANKIDLIWSVLNSSCTIALTQRLMTSVGIPFVSTVWDAPEYFAMNHHMDPVTARIMLRNYSQVLRKSRRVSVVSESTRDVYSRRYGVNGLILRHGIHPDLWHGRPDERRPSSYFTIGFAGSLYAKREWNALLDTIRCVNGSLEGRTVIVRFIGRFPKTFARAAPFVEMAGRRLRSETLEMLSEVDVAYLPYWFDRKHSYVVKTSFPSKLSTYLAAGIPVFYHGPADSSPARFFKDYPVGLCCHSLKTLDILATLKRLATDTELQKTVALARQVALSNALGLEVMLGQFAALLGIDRSQLLPLEMGDS